MDDEVLIFKGLEAAPLLIVSVDRQTPIRELA